MKKFVLTYGFIAGGMLAVMMLITFAFHDQIGFSSKGAIIGYTTMVVAFLMVFFGVRAYREHMGGTLSFGRALWVGLLIMGIASACYVATWEVIYWKLAPDFGEKYAAYEIEKARQSGATDAQLAARRREMEQFQQLYRNPLVNVALTFLEPLPVGVVMTLVAAGMLRKRKAVAA